MWRTMSGKNCLKSSALNDATERSREVAVGVSRSDELPSAGEETLGPG